MAKDKAQQKAAIAEHKAARKALAKVPVSDCETAEYRRANRAVIAAEKSIPWWRR